MRNVVNASDVMSEGASPTTTTSHRPSVPPYDIMPSMSPHEDETTGRATIERLATTFASDFSSAGVMFDVRAKNSIAIQSLDFNTVNSDDARIEVWTKNGSHRGYERRRGAWTLLVNGTVIGRGMDVPTSIPSDMFTPAIVLANETRAFYVTCVDGPCQRYSLVSGANRDFENSDLILLRNGTAKGLGFNGTFHTPRTFNGALHYNIVTPSPTNVPTIRPSDSPTAGPSFAPVANKILATKLESSVSYAGAMFDIKARETIVINSIAFNTYMYDDVTVQLYSREGHYAGNDADTSGWTLIANETVQGQGMGNLTFIPEGSFEPIMIRRKRTQAFYITSDGPYLRLAKGTTVGNITAYNSDIIVYEGVGKRYPISNMTFSPRVWNGAFQYGVVDIPTPAPTENPTLSPSVFRSFRLRLYWEEGYYWQEERRETFWCMECGECQENDSIYIKWCSDSSRQQFTKVGDTIRPSSDPSLCFTMTGTRSESRPIRLWPCIDERSGSDDQRYEGFHASERFELHPLGDTSLCLSQAHHPKDDERVWPDSCTTTRDDTTSYWITF
jgi:hypothetical protein